MKLVLIVEILGQLEPNRKMGETWLETDKLENLSWNLHLSMQKTWGLERLGENLKRGPENVSENQYIPFERWGDTFIQAWVQIPQYSIACILLCWLAWSTRKMKCDRQFRDVLQNSKIVMVFVWWLVFWWCCQILAKRLRRLGIAQGVGYHWGSLLMDAACAPIKHGDTQMNPLDLTFLPVSPSL